MAYPHPNSINIRVDSIQKETTSELRVEKAKLSLNPRLCAWVQMGIV